MTREEAIDTLKNGLWWDRRRLDEAIDIAISALRPVSREQVEKVWHGRWIKHEGYDECSECHAKSIFGYNYCHNCGASMTDEAVEMVIARLEALKDGEDRSI